VHTIFIRGISLAGMPARSEGGKRVRLGGIPPSGAYVETSAPVGSLTEQQLFTKNREILQDWKERQLRDGDSVATKKGRTDLESDIIIEENALQRLVGTAAANACRGFIGPAATGSSVDDIRSLRDEVMENIARVQT
jgi:hypothetical protein